MQKDQDLFQLRQSLKSARDAISVPQRLNAENQAIQFLIHWQQLKKAQTVACYHAVKGEFPTDQIIQFLQSENKKVYLPILSNEKQNTLNFQLITDDQRIQKNRFGIPEPKPNPELQINPIDLDLVIMPLLGFDQNNHRLGMGGGFYDRSFAFIQNSSTEKKPYLLGLAFSVQQAENLTPQPWDIPTDNVLTELGFSKTP